MNDNLVGKYFMYKGWPSICVHIWEDGRLCFGNVGNWDWNITINSHPEPMTDEELLSFAQRVFDVNAESSFYLWLGTQDYIKSLWENKKGNNSQA